MENNVPKHAHNLIHAEYVAVGVLVGGLTSAAAMLLLAPQSGKTTRAQIQLKSIQWLDRTTDFGKSALGQARRDTREIATGVWVKAKQLKQLGQDRLVRQLDRVSAAVKAA